MGNTYKYINLFYLVDMSDNSADFIIEMIQILKKQVPEFESKLKNGLQNQNIVELKKIAHKTKSALGIMGIASLNDQLKYFEDANDISLKEFENFTQSFIFTCQEAIKELDQVIEQYKTSQT